MTTFSGQLNRGVPCILRAASMSIVCAPALLDCASIVSAAAVPYIFILATQFSYIYILALFEPFAKSNYLSSLTGVNSVLAVIELEVPWGLLKKKKKKKERSNKGIVNQPNLTEPDEHRCDFIAIIGMIGSQSVSR